MRRRPLGKLGFEVTEMALGTWGISGEAYGPVYHKDVDRIIELGVELGIELYETADVYGDGKMEQKLGELLDPETTRVVTKIGTFRDAEPPRKRFDRESLARAFDASQERLRRDKLDVVLLHNPQPGTLRSDSEAVAFLRDRVAEGRLAGWGVSAGSVEVARAAIDRGAGVIELAYNLFTAGELHALTDRVAATETGVLARSVLAHGLLAGHWSKSKVFFDNDHRRLRWTAEELRYRLNQLDAVRPLVGGDVLTMRAAALRFVLSNRLVSSAVLGPRSPTQLRQLVHEAGEGPEYFDADTLMLIPELLSAARIEV